MTAAETQENVPPDYAAAHSRIAHRYRAPGILAVEGADRVAFLQGQLTQDVRALAAGRSLPTAGLSPKGKLLYFGRLVAVPDRLLLLVPAAALATATAHLARYAVFQKVRIADVTAEFQLLGLCGPEVGRVEPPGQSILLPADGEFSAGLLALSASRAEVDGLLEAAGSVAMSAETVEILRVEAGRPRFGQDADESNLPDELHLEAAIATAKGCYVGQEVVARLRTYGRVNRRLVGFRFPGASVGRATVFPDPENPARELGRVTSSVRSPRFGPIGLGFAFREIPEDGILAAPGNPDRQAIVAALPFA